MTEEIKQAILETPTQFAMRQDVTKILKIVEDLKMELAKVRETPPVNVEMGRNGAGGESWKISLRGKDLDSTIREVKKKQQELMEGDFQVKSTTGREPNKLYYKISGRAKRGD